MKIKEAIDKVRVWGVAGIANFLKRKVAFSLQRRRLAALVRRSSVDRPSRGITVIGELTGQVSLSKTLRDFVLCLKEAGVPCQTYDTMMRPQIPARDAAGVLTPPDEFDIRRYSHVVMMFRSPLDERLAPDLTFARIAFYESEHGIHETAPFLRESGDAIIAMSDFNYGYFKRAFAGQSVFKITYPFRPGRGAASGRGELRRKLGLKDGDFVVFFNFDFGSYYRKNIRAALGAFAAAFAGDDTAKLVFKTKGAAQNRRQAAEMQSIAAGLGIGGQFVHIPQYLPRADLDGLTAACDAYLSLHRAEGFGLGMAEAMSIAKPVVATGWSANTEFCRPETAWCIPYKIVPIKPHEHPAPMKEWAEADVAAAAAALREIRRDPAAAAKRAEAGAEFIARHFSLAEFKADVDAFLDGRERT